MGDLGESFRDYKEHQQRIRDYKYNKFISKTLPRLRESEKVISIEQSVDKFSITTEEFGIIDIFPKANRLLIRKKNEWYSAATLWLSKNL